MAPGSLGMPEMSDVLYFNDAIVSLARTGDCPGMTVDADVLNVPILRGTVTALIVQTTC